MCVSIHKQHAPGLEQRLPVLTVGHLQIAFKTFKNIVDV